MKTLPILTLIIAGTGLLAIPARAHDDDHDKDHDKKHKKHSEEYYYGHRPSVTIGVAAPRRPYYGQSSTVIVERTHPVYYTERQSYSGRSVEVDVQRGLARRGYYRGPIDGDLGPGSRASIRAFQADNGFAPTGRIDRGLLEALR
ncbi:MAG: hypothetical protein QOE70_2955 [Chthoniobacter sp.]|jgi:hypothetical protein|nr:hypothetical protein [Chthoniobacter sp.]